MLKKGFFINSKLASRRLSKKEKGKGIAMDADLHHDNLRCPLTQDLFSYLDPLEVSLIKDTLDEDFNFDWGSALQNFKHQDLDSFDAKLFDFVPPPQQYTTIPWSPFCGGNCSRIGGGISSGSGFREGTLSGSGIGEGASSGSGIGEGTSTSSEIEGGTSHGVEFKKDGPRQKKVRLGKNFLLIDHNLHQNLQTNVAFQFLHPQSLLVVKVQPKRLFETDMQVDMLDVPNIEVQPSTTFSCDDPPLSASFQVSQAPEEHLPTQHYLEEQLPAQDSPKEQLPVLNFDPIVHFFVGSSKRV